MTAPINLDINARFVRPFRDWFERVGFLPDLADNPAEGAEMIARKFLVPYEQADRIAAAVIEMEAE